ncbi:EamA family transporter [Paenibacillus sp. GCM10027626]|uniref:EamA family transporter n=1 Tax=Paenibacillus sp. GCM10027626 TaxID=3273411 RepID=UPI003636C1DC
MSNIVQTFCRAFLVYLVPIVTVAAAYLLLNEKITTAALLGTFLTLIGLFISERKSSQKKVA